MVGDLELNLGVAILRDDTDLAGEQLGNGNALPDVCLAEGMRWNRDGVLDSYVGASTIRKR